MDNIDKAIEQAKKYRPGKLKIFTFSFKGLYLGGDVTVVAYTEADAREVAIQQMREDKHDHNENTLELAGITEIRQGAVVQFNNGDY
jgi:hypothetical protein